MTKSSKKKPKPKYPGISLNQFKAAIEALTELRDIGKFLIFMGQRSSVKFVGDVEEFRTVFAEKLKLNEHESPTEVFGKALKELRSYLAAYGDFQDEKEMLRFLENIIYDDEFETLTDKASKTRVRKDLAEKVKLIKEKLFTRAIEERSKRMKTATNSCLEDLDYELIEERKDETQDKLFAEPFLRLRFRYSKGTDSGSSPFPFPHIFFRQVHWGRQLDMNLPSFELECDESDIDLLILRLTAAKQRLVEQRDKKNES